MIRHVVMWKLKDEAEGAEKSKNAEKIKLILEGLKTKIDELKAVEVGININEEDDQAYDVVLLADFESEMNFILYKRNPNHQKAASYIHDVVENYKVIDYKMDI